ncbi:MAG: hypothetical protein JW793_01530 [Acidobacteria bacterium]|nr:hypothetical protein [Acidobacteriota bacterium]
MGGSYFCIASGQLQSKVPALSAQSSWGEVLGFLALGVTLVLATLAGLSVLCTVTGFCFQRLDRAGQRGAATGVVQVPEASAERPHAASDDPLLPVVIATAVAMVSDDRAFRIIRFAPAHVPGEQNSWGGEGRRQIFASHEYSRHRAVRSMRQPTGKSGGLMRRPAIKN